MSQGILAVGIDLGTGSTTATFARFQQFSDAAGNFYREKRGCDIEVRDWPGDLEADAIGKVSLPTGVIYSKSSRRLLFWGYFAEHYLDDPSPEIELDQVYVVEHVKLLLFDPDEARTPTAASARYRAEREKLNEVLGKTPYEVFEDLFTEIIEHVIGSANNKYYNGIQSHQIELIMAFPSGWPDYIHTRVAQIGARVLEKAFAKHNIQDVSFGIENVYTVSETICGIKEWFRSTIAEAGPSTEFDHLPTNLDELNEGDRFLAADIGAGTACITPLELVSKNPLQVDQLGPTRSLEVSGEAVEAEFKSWLQLLFRDARYPGDVLQVTNRICRRFREVKKNCGLPRMPGSSTWNVQIPGSHENKKKGFEKDCLKIDWRFLENCFDPVIDTLESEIQQMLDKIHNIKAIVFLGQFGGRSRYLRKRLAQSRFGSVKLRYSWSGKLDVVKGAVAERSIINSSFVRRTATVHSYGTLVAFAYSPGSKGHKMFPNAMQEGAVSFEQGIDGSNWLVCIQWAIAKGTIVERGHKCVIGGDEQRYHVWEAREDVDIEFEDIIIVSDEVPPPAQPDGTSYTLWTEAHERNELIIDNQRVHVRQIPFSWNIAMSQKIDSTGNLAGPYRKEDMESFLVGDKRKKKRRKCLRVLPYDQLWDITEMQLKLHVRALFPNPTGPPTIQLAKERRLDENETTCIGESRSKALIRDIEIVAAANLEGSTNGVNDFVNEEWLALVGGPSRLQLSNEHKREHQELVQTQRQEIASPTGVRAQVGCRSIAGSALESPRNLSQFVEASASDTFKPDSRRLDGCHTCENSKRRCDCIYTFDKARGSRSCNTCNRLNLICYLTQPEWVTEDPGRVKKEQIKHKKLMSTRKRKRPDDSDLENVTTGDGSNNLNPFDSSSH